MSAPDTNTEKQVKHHRGPLVGIVLCFAFVAVLTLGWLVLYGDEQGPSDGEAGPDTNPQVSAPVENTGTGEPEPAATDN